MLDLNIVGHILGCVSTQLNKIKKKIKKVLLAFRHFIAKCCILNI